MAVLAKSIYLMLSFYSCKNTRQETFLCVLFTGEVEMAEEKTKEDVFYG